VTIVSMIGDCTTTTALALASAWPAHDPVTVVEADATGGSLSAWLETPRVPSLATLVASTSRDLDPDDLRHDRQGQTLRGEATHRSVLEAIGSMTHRPSAGIAFVAAPTSSVAAARAVDEAAASVFPALAASTHVTALIDGGRHPADARTHPTAALAHSIVLIHRQETASSRAAAVRLERHAETLERLAALQRPLVPVLIGSRPFDPDEIDTYVRSHLPSAGSSVVEPHQLLADDALAAAVLAGRSGVSARRMRRLPLMRSAAALATRLAELLERPDPSTSPRPSTTRPTSTAQAKVGAEVEG